MGRIFYCLKPVSSDAMTKTLDLFSHSAKHKRGNIELLLSIKGKVRISMSWIDLNGKISIIGLLYYRMQRRDPSQGN